MAATIYEREAMKKQKEIDTAIITGAVKAPPRKSIALYERALQLAYDPNADQFTIARLLARAAVAGNAEAIYALATWRLFGHEPVFRKDLKEATRLLSLASDVGFPAATYDLAVCRETGEGIRKSENLAFLLYLRAALHGDKDSVEEVGRCYYWGIGTKKDRRSARVWFDFAEEIGART